MLFDRGDAIALGSFAAGIAVIVFFVIPQIDVAIVALDLIFGGL